MKAVKESFVCLRTLRPLLLLGGLLGTGAAAWAAPEVVLGKVVALPNTVAEVYCPSSGRILSPRERPFLVGDRVKQGDPLAIIEHRYNLHDAAHLSTIRWDLLSTVIEARRVALQARVEREKAERLLRLGTMSGQQVQALRAAELVAKAEYDKRRTLLSQQDTQMQGSDLVRRGIFSPIDGEISFANFSQGQLINEGFLLYRVVNRKEVGIAARIPESEYRLLPEKATSKIRFDALPGKVFVGRLEVTPPVVDPLSRTREVIFRVDNAGESLHYGMIGRVEVPNQ